jgi:methionyl aminopeptidase
VTTQIDCDRVYGNAEGTAGQTSACGDDPEHYKAGRDVRALWDEVREQWFTTGMTRTAHEAHGDGSLADADIRPNPNLWVPGMEIRHPTRRFGAFYENLLLEDKSFASRCSLRSTSIR